jgi:hypothetical protein
VFGIGGKRCDERVCKRCDPSQNYRFYNEVKKERAVGLSSHLEG